ncbi:hypothetical protein NQ314_001094 [Rhamnusium bicolor]|uniref:Uncharacterized protein n=1 Tax=Rhamnusium bicolor TaxID=1586634 RepID=A0AAV8ZT78_9CUCU|nr:hypothetical protein NQ314_001094 [Rhamnusium bicolor]
MAKKVREMAKEDENWKAFVRAEDDSGVIWNHNWETKIVQTGENSMSSGFVTKMIYDIIKLSVIVKGSRQHENSDKTEQSEFLSGVKETAKEDNRKLSRVPESVNHIYGWVAREEEFRLQKYGPDNFKTLPLPKLYRIPKH